MSKVHLALLFGGQSAEHEISHRSARNVLAALDSEKYAVDLIGITLEGEWFLQLDQKAFIEGDARYCLKEKGQRLSLLPGASQPLYNTETNSPLQVEMVFPILHGPRGEDGAMQGLLKILNLPFVGCDVLGSAVGMDKEVMKRLLEHAEIPTPPCLSFRDDVLPELDDVLAQLGGFPLFVKPANMGSSVGIHKIDSASEFEPALRDAYRYDSKIILEKGLNCREVEVAVLGKNAAPKVSHAGEVITEAHTFYSFDEKYTSESHSQLMIPAQLNEAQRHLIHERAAAAYTALECTGLSRIDFFITEDEIYINEINTLPGFTQISMYPKLWAETGLPYSDLIDALIDLAFERYQGSQKRQIGR